MLKENQFYCVKCRKRVVLPEKSIKYKEYRNRKVGKSPALRGKCPKCSTNVTKFVKRSASPKLKKKYV